MSLGLVRMGMKSPAFWALGVGEWLALCRALAGTQPAPMTRADLSTLMEDA